MYRGLEFRKVLVNEAVMSLLTSRVLHSEFAGDELCLDGDVCPEIFYNYKPHIYMLMYPTQTYHRTLWWNKSRFR